MVNRNFLTSPFIEDWNPNASWWNPNPTNPPFMPPPRTKPIPINAIEIPSINNTAGIVAVVAGILILLALGRS
jgi:hypothetical protein